MNATQTNPNLEQLLQALRDGQNILVVGPTGSGKVKLLNLLHEQADALDTRAFITGEVRDPQKAALVSEIAGSVPTAAMMQAESAEQAWMRLGALRSSSEGASSMTMEDAKRLFPVVALTRAEEPMSFEVVTP